MPLTNTTTLQSPIPINSNLTITSVNAQHYYGQTLAFQAAWALTLSVGLPAGFWCRVNPPSLGNASLVSDGTVLLNGATTTLARAGASTLIWVAQVATDSYAVTGSAAASSTIRTLGDSITVGLNSTSHALSWSGLFSSYLAMTESDLGVAGTQIIDQCFPPAAQCYLGVSIPTKDRWAWLTGYNDMRDFGTGADGLETYRRPLRSGIAWISRSATDCKQGSNGGWAFAGASWQLITVGNLDTAFSNNAGDTATISVTGTAITFSYISHFGLGDGGLFTIKIDGVTVATVDSAFGSSSGFGGTTYVPMALRFSGLSPGAHTVVMTIGAGGFSQVCFVTGNGEATKPVVNVCSCLKMTPAGYATGTPYNNGSSFAADLYDSAALQICLDAKADGRDVRYANPNDFYNVNNISTDLVHPNDPGHRQIFNAFVNGA